MAYEAALAVAPEHLMALQGLMALHERMGLEDDQDEQRLKWIQSRCTDARWRQWATGQLAER